MVDMTLCNPTKYLKKCEKCYRLKAKPDMWQSFSNFYDECKGNKYVFFMSMKRPKPKHLSTSVKELDIRGKDERG